MSKLYKFDFTNAEQKIKDLFTEFKTENKDVSIPTINNDIFLFILPLCLVLVVLP